MGTDIENRLQGALNASQQDADLRAIVDCIPAFIVLAARDGTAEYLNRFALEYLGVTLDQMLGWKALDTAHPDDLPSALAAWKHAVSTGEPYHFVQRVRRADGVYRWFDIRGLPMRDESGQVTRWFIVDADIDEQVRNEAALKQSEAFLAKAQELSQTGALAWRVDDDEIIWSDEIYRILEVEPDTKPSFDLIYSRTHPEDLPALERMFDWHRAHGGDYEHERRLLMPDGRVKYVHLVGHAIRGENGKLEYIAALQDVTQRRVAEQALGKVRTELAHVARVASLGTLTASIAHEVNQPLAGIITNANTCLRMLASEPPNLEGARKTAQRTIRDGHRASDVIQRLRDLFTRKDFSAEQVDLNAATQEVIAMLMSELQRHDVMLVADLADALHVRADRVQLQQVVVNLLLNASEAMQAVTDRPRHLRVGTRVNEDGEAQLDVRDNGTGFDADDANRLFDAFYTTKRAGMGIGLSVSRSIIERHGGRLWATANDDHGACFHFTVPLWVETAQATSGESVQSDTASLDGENRKAS